MAALKSRRPRAARKARGHGHERRGEILAAAQRLFMSEGYETVTTRQLAQQVGISQTGLYVYFRNKEEILEELSRSTFERLNERIQAVIAERPRGVAVLRRLLEGYLAFALENSDEYTLTFMVKHASLKHHEKKDLTLPSAEQPVALQVFLAFRDEVARLISQRVLRRADATVVTQALWGALHGLATLLISYPTFPWAERSKVIGTLVDTLVEGLRARR